MKSFYTKPFLTKQQRSNDLSEGRRKQTLNNIVSDDLINHMVFKYKI